MALTLSDLRTRLNVRTGDPDGNFLSSAERDMILNDAARKVASDLYRNGTALLTAHKKLQLEPGVTKYALPDDLIGVQEVFWEDSNTRYEVEQRPLQSFQDIDRTGDRPTYFDVFGQTGQFVVRGNVFHGSLSLGSGSDQQGLSLYFQYQSSGGINVSAYNSIEIGDIVYNLTDDSQGTVLEAPVIDSAGAVTLVTTLTGGQRNISQRGDSVLVERGEKTLPVLHLYPKPSASSTVNIVRSGTVEGTLSQIGMNKSDAFVVSADRNIGRSEGGSRVEAVSTLKVAITDAVATSIQLEDTSGVLVGDLLLIGYEFMAVSAVNSDGNTLTVVRGFGPSTASASHLISATVSRFPRLQPFELYGLRFSGGEVGTAREFENLIIETYTDHTDTESSRVLWLDYRRDSTDSQIHITPHQILFREAAESGDNRLPSYYFPSFTVESDLDFKFELLSLQRTEGLNVYYARYPRVMTQVTDQFELPEIALEAMLLHAEYEVHLKAEGGRNNMSAQAYALYEMELQKTMKFLRTRNIRGSKTVRNVMHGRSFRYG